MKKVKSVMCPTEMPNSGKKNISNRDLRIVTVGGGTGNSVLLRGLKKYSTNVTTIVTVADDGGGSGVLRADLGMLPPGDIRACLIALANTEPAMEKLMQYRFKEGSYKGQNFGNLFLAAMNDIYGSFDVAIKETANVLAITGKVLPMTLENIVLYAKLEDGSVIEGESNITFLTRQSGGKIKEVFLKPTSPEPLEEAIDEISKADLIILGPGSLYTSIMPNLLVEKISQAIALSSAPVYYNVNVMTQAGETDGFSVTDHVNAIHKHVGKKIIDRILVNNEHIPKEQERKYYFTDKTEAVYLKEAEKETLEKEGYKVIEGPFVDVKLDYIRTDSIATMKAIMKDFNENFLG